MESKRSRIILPTREVEAWKVDEESLKIWKFLSRQRTYVMTCSNSFRTDWAPGVDANGPWSSRAVHERREGGGAARYEAQKWIQIATAYGHWKNRWSWESIPDERRTQLSGTVNPHEARRSRVGRRPRMACHAMKEHLGISSLNQISLCQGTGWEATRVLFQVALVENWERSDPHHFSIRIYQVLLMLKESW